MPGDVQTLGQHHTLHKLLLASMTFKLAERHSTSFRNPQAILLLPTPVPQILLTTVHQLWAAYPFHSFTQPFGISPIAKHLGLLEERREPFFSCPREREHCFM